MLWTGIESLCRIFFPVVTKTKIMIDRLDCIDDNYEIEWMVRVSHVRSLNEAKHLHQLLINRRYDNASIRDMVVWTLYRMCDIGDHSYEAWAVYYKTTCQKLEEEYVRCVE
jgi:hypothetical protein